MGGAREQGKGNVTGSSKGVGTGKGKGRGVGLPARGVYTCTGETVIGCAGTGVWVVGLRAWV